MENTSEKKKNEGKKSSFLDDFIVKNKNK